MPVIQASFQPMMLVKKWKKIKHWIKTIRNGLILTLSTWLSTSCYQLTFHHDFKRLSAQHHATASQADFFLATQSLEPPVQLKSYCPGGVSQLRIEQTFYDGMIHYMTLGMYSPQTVKVWCSHSIR